MMPHCSYTALKRSCNQLFRKLALSSEHHKAIKGIAYDRTALEIKRSSKETVWHHHHLLTVCSSTCPKLVINLFYYQQRHQWEVRARTGHVAVTWPVEHRTAYPAMLQQINSDRRWDPSVMLSPRLQLSTDGKTSQQCCFHTAAYHQLLPEEISLSALEKKSYQHQFFAYIRQFSMYTVH